VGSPHARGRAVFSDQVLDFNLAQPLKSKGPAGTIAYKPFEVQPIFGFDEHVHVDQDATAVISDVRVLRVVEITSAALDPYVERNK